MMASPERGREICCGLRELKTSKQIDTFGSNTGEIMVGGQLNEGSLKGYL